MAVPQAERLGARRAGAVLVSSTQRPRNFTRGNSRVPPRVSRIWARSIRSRQTSVSVFTSARLSFCPRTLSRGCRAGSGRPQPHHVKRRDDLPVGGPHLDPQMAARRAGRIPADHQLVPASPRGEPGGSEHDRPGADGPFKSGELLDPDELNRVGPRCGIGAPGLGASQQAQTKQGPGQRIAQTSRVSAGVFHDHAGPLCVNRPLVGTARRAVRWRSGRLGEASLLPTLGSRPRCAFAESWRLCMSRAARVPPLGGRGEACLLAEPRKRGTLTGSCSQGAFIEAWRLCMNPLLAR